GFFCQVWDSDSDHWVF
nr:immunoglobulin light chain junction region [Macaca mulatta]